MRQAKIFRKGILAGTLIEDGGEYRFCYDETYREQKNAQPISLTLPLQEESMEKRQPDIGRVKLSIFMKD